MKVLETSQMAIVKANGICSLMSGEAQKICRHIVAIINPMI